MVVSLMFTGSMINSDYVPFVQVQGFDKIVFTQHDCLFAFLLLQRQFEAICWFMVRWINYHIIFIIGISIDTSQCICNHYQCLFNIEVQSVRNLTIKNIFYVWHLELRRPLPARMPKKISSKWVSNTIYVLLIYFIIFAFENTNNIIQYTYYIYAYAHTYTCMYIYI